MSKCKGVCKKGKVCKKKKRKKKDGVGKKAKSVVSACLTKSQEWHVQFPAKMRHRHMVPGQMPGGMPNAHACSP